MAANTYNINGIDFEELNGSPMERTEIGGKFSVSRKLKCKWEDRLALANALGGDPGDLPSSYPLNKTARVKAIQISPFSESPSTGSQGVNDYTDALLDVGYDQLEYADTPTEDENRVQILEETFENTGEVVNLPQLGLYWEVNSNISTYEGWVPLTESEVPGIYVPRRKWTVSLYNLRSIPSGLSENWGKCNESLVRSITSGESFAEETVLYMGSSTGRSYSVTSEGQGQFSAYRVTLNFMIQPYSWNKFWRRGYDEPQPIYDGFFGTPQEWKPVKRLDFESAFEFRFEPIDPGTQT